MSCSAHAAVTATNRVPVRVNGVTIPHDIISREAQNHPAPTPIAAWTAAARALAVRELLLQEARRTPWPEGRGGRKKRGANATERRKSNSGPPGRAQPPPPGRPPAGLQQEKPSDSDQPTSTKPRTF